jgi:hypothetical protein
MAQETLKLTITADTAEALANLNNFIKTSKGLKTEMQNFGNVSGQATNALTNLSRVAQDAPYGFIGIANNLNPLLESFQRLSKEAGGSGAALKAMAGGLMGPAGIGLALGAVSSIIVAFGPKIMDFINGTNKATEAEDKFAKSLSDARAEASETGIRLQAYLTITQNASVSDERRAEALRAVKNELGKVNSAYASTITNVDQARSAVDLYTKALVAQAITSRYIDQIADKTVALNDVTKKALQAATDYNKASQKLAETPVPVSDQIGVYQRITENAIKAGKVYTNFANETISLSSSITELNKDLENTIQISLSNPFFVLDKGAKELSKSTKQVADNIKKIGGEARGISTDMNAPVLLQRGAAPTITSPTGAAPLGGRTSGYDAIQITRDINEQTKAQELFNFQLQQTQAITGLLAPAFDSVIQAMVMGEDVGKALQAAFQQIVIQLISMVAQALLFKAIMAAITGGTSIATDAVGGGVGSGAGNFLGEFLLKGSDLVLATQRANNNLNIRRGN